MFRFDLPRVVVVTALAGAVMLGAVACAGQTPATSAVAPAGQGAVVQQAPPAAPAPRVAQSGTVTVEMKDMTFEPATITVKPGTTVVWKNTSQVPHVVASDTGLFDSGQAPSEWIVFGKEFSYTFEKAGTYSYNCTPHKAAGMVGKVVVAE
ncbi:MAG TPA: plastocyanin/azurin family copper-binding protein [Chloroflexota bacterium]|nr:plastocyanin/azurin family copper-binding protein [Chloroflexota bacterium]